MISTWVSMFGVSQIVGALMMYGIGSTEHAIATWRVLFLVCGGLTVVAGIVFVVVMPRDTATAWFLNERERELATRRLALDRATRDRAHFDWAQVKEAFTDPRTALYCLMALCITLPTPIVKVRSQVASFVLSSTNKKLVLLARHQWFRVHQVRDYAGRPAQRSHRFHPGLDWWPRPKILPQHTLFLWCFPGDYPHDRDIDASVAALQRLLGNRCEHLVCRKHRSPSGPGCGIDDIECQGKYEEVGRQRHFLRLLLHRLYYWASAMAKRGRTTIFQGLHYQYRELGHSSPRFCRVLLHFESFQQEAG